MAQMPKNWFQFILNMKNITKNGMVTYNQSIRMNLWVCRFFTKSVLALPKLVKATHSILSHDVSLVQLFLSHCSGHARGQDLLKAVSEIGAKILYPIHTEHPEEYKKVSKNMVLIDEGKKYVLWTIFLQTLFNDLFSVSVNP